MDVNWIKFLVVTAIIVICTSSLVFSLPSYFYFHLILLFLFNFLFLYLLHLSSLLTIYNCNAYFEGMLCLGGLNK